MSKTNHLTMSPPDEPGGVTSVPACRERDEAIRAAVLRILGRPARLFRVAVVALWDNNYRVNVLTGDDASAVVIPNSYFVTADESGKILDSSPPIRKLY
jgi:hypothetical protein